jgi:hypothetical protein
MTPEIVSHRESSPMLCTCFIWEATTVSDRKVGSYEPQWRLLLIAMRCCNRSSDRNWLPDLLTARLDKVIDNQQRADPLRKPKALYLVAASRRYDVSRGWVSSPKWDLVHWRWNSVNDLGKEITFTQLSESRIIQAGTPLGCEDPFRDYWP